MSTFWYGYANWDGWLVVETARKRGSSRLHTSEIFRRSFARLIDVWKERTKTSRPVHQMENHTSYRFNLALSNHQCRKISCAEEAAAERPRKTCCGPIRIQTFGSNTQRMNGILGMVHRSKQAHQPSSMVLNSREHNNSIPKILKRIEITVVRRLE